MYKKALAALSLAFAGNVALAQPAVEYEIEITNITPGQTFTPQLAVTHPRSVQLFSLGEAASEELEILAEGGMLGPAKAALEGSAMDIQSIDAPLPPGQSAYVTVIAHPVHSRLTVAAMMIPTNDNFMALNSVPLPRHGAAVHLVPGYDAGTEYNDQSCQHIPGPHCNFVGEGYSEETGEGYIHIGNGFHELGDTDEDGFDVLPPGPYDWRNSVARITVRRK